MRPGPRAFHSINFLIKSEYPRTVHSNYPHNSLEMHAFSSFRKKSFFAKKSFYFPLPRKASPRFREKEVYAPFLGTLVIRLFSDGGWEWLTIDFSRAKFLFSARAQVLLFFPSPILFFPASSMKLGSTHMSDFVPNIDGCLSIKISISPSKTWSNRRF